MGEFKVAYGYPISQEKLKEIQSISPDLHLVDIIDLIKDEHGEDSSKAQKATRELDTILRDVEVFYGLKLPKDLLKRAPKFRWIQYYWVGFEAHVGRDILDSPIVLTNARGVSALCIAEWVVMMMLMFCKQANDFLAERRDRTFGRVSYELSELQGKTVGVVGLGAIGEEVARLSKAFRTRVLATKRSVTHRQSAVGYVDELLPPTELDHLLENSDFVVLCLPITSETDKLIEERELRLMRPTSYIINIARGKIIDEPVLVRALKEGWIAGAGLDVFETEPLPPESELWDLDNVITAPHISGDVERYGDRTADLFIRNLKRYIKGEGLISVVKKDLGY